MVAVLVVAAVAALSLIPMLTPQVQPASAPDTVFSAERAMADVRFIARTPRPTGSARLATVRQHLVGELAAVGVRTEVVEQDTCRANSSGGLNACGHVVNLRATVPGRDGSESVVLVAHVDSIAGGPGAADNAYAVASMLEIARVLRAGPQLRNDVILLITDGEEAGLLGAQAAVEAELLPDPGRSVVLNLEARGNRAPFVMFETNGGAARLVDTLRDDPAHATSLAPSVYGLLDNSTDFSVLGAAGYPGMGFASIGNTAVYDTALDTVDRADPGSVQAVGETTLDSVRRLADTDLAGLSSGPSATYFTIFGLLVSYPPPVDIAVAVAAVALLGAAVVLGRRRGLLSVSRLLPGALASLPPVLVAFGLGLLGWPGLKIIRSDYIGLLSGMPYRPWLTALGFVLVLAASGIAWNGIVGRRLRAVELAGGVAAVFAAGTAAMLLVVPSAAYLLGWPAVIAAAVLLAAVTVPTVRERFALFWALPAAITTALLVPMAYLLFVVVGLELLLVPLVVIGLATVLAQAATPPLRRWIATSTVLLVGGVAGIGAGLLVDRTDSEHPRQLPFVYAAEFDTGQTYWLSPFPEDDPFLDQYLTNPDQQPWTNYPLLYAPVYRSGPAVTVPVAEPDATVVSSDVAGDTRTIRLRVSVSDPAASLVAVYVDTTKTPVVSATVAGRPVPGSDQSRRPAPWGWGVSRVGDVTAGWDLELTVRGTGPVQLRLLAQTPGVPAEALDGPLPDTVTGGLYPSMQTLGGRTITV